MFTKFKVRFWFRLQMFAWKRLQKYVWLPKPGGVIWTEIVAKPDNEEFYRSYRERRKEYGCSGSDKEDS